MKARNASLHGMENPVDRAAKVYGSQQAMATALGVTKAAVWQWKEDGRQIPVQYCVAIERDTGVTRRDLRPKDWHLIWPELADIKTPEGA
jgi:DNA-binding transcriptional regulator YdaS (Cro superfamily)